MSKTSYSDAMPSFCYVGYCEIEGSEFDRHWIKTWSILKLLLSYLGWNNYVVLKSSVLCFWNSSLRGEIIIIQLITFHIFIVFYIVLFSDFGPVSIYFTTVSILFSALFFPVWKIRINVWLVIFYRGIWNFWVWKNLPQQISHTSRHSHF